MPVSERVLEIRMHAARNFLLNSTRSVGEVARLWSLEIVLFELTDKRFSADLSRPCASVICTQLERNNNFQH